MRFSCLIRPLGGVAFLLAATVPAFDVSVRPMRGLEGDVFTAAYVEAAGERFALVVPNGWRAGVAGQTNALSLHSRSGESPITIVFSDQDATLLLTNAQALRQAVVPFLSEATLLEEFPAYSGYGPGRGLDFSFVLHGHSMMARAVVIPLAHGFASFHVACSAENKASFLRDLGATLTSFRSTSNNLVESGTLGFQSSKGGRPKARLASAAQNFDVLHTEPPAPPQPKVIPKSIFAGREDYIRLGFVSVLMVVLVSRTLARHRQEAEIRALHGGYLSDGTAVASFKMPDLFAPAPMVPDWPGVRAKLDELAADGPLLVMKTRMDEFLDQAPAGLAALRQALEELGQAGHEADWRQALAALPRHVTALREKADFWEARPVWQMSSALELLVQRVAEKPRDATASTLRTITAATDLLHLLCAPGIRPDLLIDPPIQVLAVDDNPLCLRAMVFALQKASLTADVADNGQRSLALAFKKAYDVIFMDIQMPEMDGLTACQKIHETELNATTPVVFVTIQSDFHTRTQSNVLGGTDFMAKPFLVFELTVKALMFAMRKRLGLGTVSQVASAPGAKPATVATPITPTPASVPTPTRPTVSPRGEGVPLAVDFNRDLLAEAPDYAVAMRKLLEAVAAAADETARREPLGQMKLWTQTLAAQAKLRPLPVTTRLAAVLEALLNRLHQNPKMITASTLNTVAKAVNLLETLCVPGGEGKFSEDAPVKILVVEDEPLTRRAIVGALQLAYQKPDSAGDGTAALTLAGQKPYDVIFTDVEMPGLDGYELCTQLRDGGPNRSTPVVFITSHTDAAAYAQAAESGGTDFIAKPFHPLEIAVKALTFAWEGRLQKTKGRSALTSSASRSQGATPGGPPAPLREPAPHAVA